MKVLPGILAINLGLISVSAMLFASGASNGYDDVFHPPIEFYFGHVPTSFLKAPYPQPDPGSVILHVKAFQKNFFGTTLHSAATPARGLTLDGSSYGKTDYGFFTGPFGRYIIDVHCSGAGKFAGQETSLHRFLDVAKHERVAVILNVACPVNDTRTALTAPQLKSSVMW